MSRMTVFPADEFRRLALEGAVNLLNRGFVFTEADECSVTIEATPIRIRFTQDRGGQIDAQISCGDSSGYVGLDELARFLDFRREAAVFCHDRASAVDAITEFGRFLEGPAILWLRSDPVAWSDLCAWLEVDRPLRTQHFTRIARPEMTWSLIMSAWEDRRFGNALKLLRALPVPYSDAERRAMDYCARMLKAGS